MNISKNLIIKILALQKRAWTWMVLIQPWKIVKVRMVSKTGSWEARGGVFRVIEAPRRRPFGGGADHRTSGIGTSQEYWCCAVFHRKSLKIFFLTLFGGYGMLCLRPHRSGTPPGEITPEEGTTTSSQCAGAVRGDRHCPLRKSVLCNLLKTQDLPWKTHGYSSCLPESVTHVRFYRAKIFLIYIVKKWVITNALIVRLNVSVRRKNVESGIHIKKY